MKGINETTTMKERYEYLVKSVTAARNSLNSAKNATDVKSALDRLDYLMDRMSGDSYLEDVKDELSSISEDIAVVKRHDKVRSEVDEKIQNLLEKAEKTIQEEEKKERRDKLQEFFFILAENATEIAEIIDFSQLFG